MPEHPTTRPPSPTDPPPTSPPPTTLPPFEVPTSPPMVKPEIPETQERPQHIQTGPDGAPQPPSGETFEQTIARIVGEALAAPTVAFRPASGPQPEMAAPVSRVHTKYLDAFKDRDREDFESALPLAVLLVRMYDNQQRDRIDPILEEMGYGTVNPDHVEPGHPCTCGEARSRVWEALEPISPERLRMLETAR